MKRIVLLAAGLMLFAGPQAVWADGPEGEMTSQMHEWVDYERPTFEPLEVRVDGVRLTVFDATIESLGLEDDASIVKVVMRARRGGEPAAISHAALKGVDGKTYPVSYVKAPPVKALEEEGFRSYAFRLRETGQEELESLEVTVASAADGAGPATTQVKLEMGEQVRFSDLDFATFSALPAFFMFFYYALATSSAF